LNGSLSISSSLFPSPNFYVSTFNPLVWMAMPANLARVWIEPKDIQFFLKKHEMVKSKFKFDLHIHSSLVLDFGQNLFLGTQFEFCICSVLRGTWKICYEFPCAA
jgi:hypothetical protein